MIGCRNRALPCKLPITRVMVNLFTGFFSADQSKAGFHPHPAPEAGRLRPKNNQ